MRDHSLSEGKSVNSLKTKGYQKEVVMPTKEKTAMSMALFGRLVMRKWPRPTATPPPMPVNRDERRQGTSETSWPMIVACRQTHRLVLNFLEIHLL